MLADPGNLVNLAAGHQFGLQYLNRLSWFAISETFDFSFIFSLELLERNPLCLVKASSASSRHKEETDLRFFG